MPKVKAAEVYIPVTTTAGKATSDMKGLNRELKKTDKAVSKTSKNSNIMSTALGVGVAGAAALAAHGMLNLARGSIAAASQAEETANKFNVVFSSISDEANKTALSIANAYGLSQKESQELLSNTGDLLTGFGMSQKAAFNMSKAVTKLSADVLSTNPVPLIVVNTAVPSITATANFTTLLLFFANPLVADILFFTSTKTFK